MRDAHEKLGKKLAAGCSKVAYEYLGDPSKVILRVGRGYQSSMEKEMRLLDQLGSYGMPVLKFHETYVHDQHLYVVADRYKKGSKDNPDVMALTTEKTVAAFDLIEAGAIRHHVFDVSDFQFLWAEDGSIAIGDPLEISFNDTHFKRYYDGGNLWYQKWQPVVEYAYQIKAGNTPGSFSYNNAHNWWANTGKKLQRKRRSALVEREKLEAATCAAMGIPTVRHRWRMLEAGKV